MQNTLIYTYKQGVARTKELLNEELVKKFLVDFSPYEYNDIMSDDIVKDYVSKAYHLLNCRMLYNKQLAPLHKNEGVVFLPVEYARWLPSLCVILASLGDRMGDNDTAQIAHLGSVINVMIKEANRYVTSDNPSEDDVDFKNDEEVLEYIFNQYREEDE